jgi:predicted Fe-Mo cluster-binding NifX family protein
LATVTYFVALAFMRTEDGDIVACEPKEAQSADQAKRMASALAALEPHCGAVAFSRTGDPAIGEFSDAVILKTVGEVDGGLVES